MSRTARCSASLAAADASNVAIAAEATPWPRPRAAGQLARAWLLPQGAEIVPIPGAKRCAHLSENLGALDARLSAEDEAGLARAVNGSQVCRRRLPKGQLALIGL